MAFFVNIIYHVLIVSIVLGGLFSRTTLTTQASILREAALFLLILIVIGVRHSSRRLTSGFVHAALVLLFISFMFGVVTTGLYDLDVRTISNKWAVLYKFFQVFMLILCFSAYEKLTNRPIEYLVRWFVVYLSVYALISPVLYFNPPPFMMDGFRWWGRFGVGYPTMDAQLFTLAVIMILFGGALSGWKRGLSLALCLWGILIQVTGTGFVSILVVLAMYALLHFRASLRSIPALTLATLAGITGLLMAGPEITGTAVDLFWVKVQNLTGGGADVNTLDIRDDQFKVLMYMIRHDALANIFGVGVGIYVENQYGFSRVAFGIFGACALFIFIGLLLTEGVRRRRRDGGVLLATAVVVALTFYTLTFFYLYPLTAALALALVYSEKRKSAAIATAC